MGLLTTTRGMFTAPDTTEQPDISRWVLDALQQVEDQLAPVQVTTGHVAQSGWSVSSFFGHIVAKTAVVSLAISRTGSTIGGSANGNVGNSDVVLLPAAFKPRSQPAQLTVAHVGYLGAFYVWTDGMVGLGALPPNVSCATNDSFTIGGTWRVA